MSEWVRCDEKLPADDDHVLVFYHGIKLGWAFIHHDGGATWYDASACDCVNPHISPTHWMPLPEPPASPTDEGS